MTTIPTLAAARAYIAQMDLQMIVAAMCGAHYSLPRWIPKEANHCAKLYKNFLYLQRKYRDQPLVPTREIDEFWHNHILYTQKYTEDCQHIFGHYLHHLPADPAASESLIEHYQQTKTLYLAEFNEELTLIRAPW